MATHGEIPCPPHTARIAPWPTEVGYRVHHKFGNTLFCWLRVIWCKEQKTFIQKWKIIEKLQNCFGGMSSIGERWLLRQKINTLSPIIIFYETYNRITILSFNYLLFFAQGIPVWLYLLVSFSFIWAMIVQSVLKGNQWPILHFLFYNPHPMTFTYLFIYCIPKQRLL